MFYFVGLDFMGQQEVQPISPVNCFWSGHGRGSVGQCTFKTIVLAGNDLDVVISHVQKPVTILAHLLLDVGRNENLGGCSVVGSRLLWR